MSSAPPPRGPLRSVAAVVGRRVAPFELGIACQVFGLDRSAEGLPAHDFALCSAEPGEVPTTAGFTVNVAHGLDRVRSADLVVVPAWPDHEDAPDPRTTAALREAVEAGATVLSICTGAYLPAHAGLLDGRRAATHWQHAAALAERFPRVRVDADVLYVHDGPILTSAGAAAGIDAALHLVRLHHGAAVANALARRMVVPAQRAGGQAQFVEPPASALRAARQTTDDVERARDAGGAAVLALLDHVSAHLDEPWPVERLAAQVHLAPRTFVRRFAESTGTTPHRWVLEQRLLLAEQLLETTDLPVEAVARRTGLGSTDTLRHHVTARRGVPPATYRATFASPR